MAQRDRTQGIAFVYTNLAEALRKREALESHAPLDTGSAQKVNLPKEVFHQARSSQSPEAPTHQERVARVKANLDRLQSLHHKLHAMLAELNQMTNGKKNSKE